MKKWNLVYWIAGVFLLLIVAQNMRSINNGMADAMLAVIKSRIHKPSSFGFKSKDVDRLFNKKTYRYFLFVKRLPIQYESLLSASQDSVLIIKSKNLSDWNIGLDCDTISLAESIFDYVIEGKNNSALYSIEVSEQNTLNRYEMNKIAESFIR